jgi:hypothetical protein
MFFFSFALYRLHRIRRRCPESLKTNRTQCNQHNRKAGKNKYLPAFLYPVFIPAEPLVGGIPCNRGAYGKRYAD